MVKIQHEIHTPVLRVSLSGLDVNKEGNLHAQLNICEGARVMLTYSMDLEDRLINGSTETIIHMKMPPASDLIHGTIYVELDDLHAGKSHKNLCFVRQDLRHYISVVTTVKTFPYSHKNHVITVQRKQFHLKGAFAIALHNSTK